MNHISRHGLTTAMQHLLNKLVRFYADYRIKPHAPPLVKSPRQFLWVLILRPYSPGGMLNPLGVSPNSMLPDDWHSSFTVWTTRVSNPVCSPHFRTSASVSSQWAAFATDVPPNIYEFHLYTRNSTHLSRTPDHQFWRQFRGWAPGFHPQLDGPPTCALRPVIPNNANPLRITAAAGTELAGVSLPATVIIITGERALRS